MRTPTKIKDLGNYLIKIKKYFKWAKDFFSVHTRWIKFSILEQLDLKLRRKYRTSLKFPRRYISSSWKIYYILPPPLLFIWEFKNPMKIKFRKRFSTYKLKLLSMVISLAIFIANLWTGLNNLMKKKSWSVIGYPKQGGKICYIW